MGTQGSEKDLARHFEMHKDDAEEWEETPEVAEVGPRGDSVVLSVRMRPEEVDQLREAAHALGGRVSDVVRDALRAFPVLPVVPRIQYAPGWVNLFVRNADRERHVTRGPDAVPIEEEAYTR